MTPKEKAENLVHQNRMLLMDYGDDYGEEILISVLAIKLALNTVDEILDIDCFDMSEEHFDNHIEYWQEVKKEIEKL